jgi:methyl-accepting chemotaxis protein
MNIRFGRSQQMWMLMVTCILLFGIFLWLIEGMTFGLWWRVMLAAATASGLCAVLFQIWLKRVLSRREGMIKLIDQVSSGDLSLSARDIINETQSARMATAMRGLVANLERTIRRFGQLANDVARASEQISGRSRILARSATDQLASTETTSGSVTQIDQSINTVRRSM